MLSTRDRLKKQRHILILLWAVALVLGVLAGGNTYEPQPTHANVENTTDGGLTWHSQTVPNCSGYGDGVPLWLAANINDGNSAIYTSLCPGDSGARMTLSRSTDQGITWAV